MTIIANTYITPSVKGMKEDFADFISNISRTDTPFQSMIGSTSLHNTYFQWQTDALAAPAANAKLEGDQLAPEAVTATTVVGNSAQISWKLVTVSRTMEQTSRYGRAGELAYQVIKKSKELKRDIEKQITGNLAAVARDSTTAGVTGGAECWYETNVSRGASGANGGFSAAPGPAAPTDGTGRAISESLISAVLLSCYTNGSKADVIMLPPKHKQYLSSVLTGGNTRMVDADEKKLYAAIDDYDSDFGLVKIVPNWVLRYTAGSVVGAAHVIDPSMWKLAWLDPIKVVDKPLIADVTAFKQIVGEYGLMCMNEKGSGIVADLS